MEKNESIGQRIVDGRKRLGLTREKFAELIGVSAYFVGQIERGDRKMSFETLIKISDCLRLSLDYLVKGVVVEQASEGSDHTDDELIQLINECTPQEKALLLDLLKVAMPHLGRLNQ